MPRATNLLRHWIVVVFLLFPILALAGILMRGVQSGRLDALGAWFYPMMTLHGVGMVGLWYVAAMACATDIVTRATGATLAFGRLALVGTVAGVGLLLLSVLGGRFAAGWYFLYPLPMYGNWPAWATVAFLVSLTLLGATWLVWTLDLMRAIATRYRLHETLGWHYLAGRDQPTLPPALLIITVSLICSVAALVAAVVLIVLFLVDIAGGGAADPLLMKNLTFFFGHTLVNLAMYLGVALVEPVDSRARFHRATGSAIGVARASATGLAAVRESGGDGSGIEGASAQCAERNPFWRDCLAAGDRETIGTGGDLATARPSSSRNRLHDVKSSSVCTGKSVK